MSKFDRDLMFSSASGAWKTPESLLLELHKEFGLLFDVSRTHSGTFDAFKDEWGAKIYCNPPYGPKVREWLDRLLEEMKARWFRVAVFLLPARTDTKWFHDVVLPHASEIRFIKGRLKFSGHKNSAPFPSMLVIFRV